MKILPGFVQWKLLHLLAILYVKSNVKEDCIHIILKEIPNVIVILCYEEYIALPLRKYEYHARMI